MRQTLESLRNEEILEDVEVLIVDDGSTDGTAKIGKEYEKRYPQTYRVISKTNGGHGSTINCGIEQSRGTFFKVVDGDDWVNTEALIEVVRRLKTCGADYVVTDYCEVNDKTKEQVRKQFPALDVCREIRFENAAEKVQIPMHGIMVFWSACIGRNHLCCGNPDFIDALYKRKQYIFETGLNLESAAFFFQKRDGGLWIFHIRTVYSHAGQWRKDY